MEGKEFAFLFLFAFIFVAIEASPALNFLLNQAEEERQDLFRECADTQQECLAGNDCSCCEQYDKCDCVWIDGIRNCKCKKVAFEAKWKKNLNCKQLQY
uniref:U8-Theriditoxin-Lha1a_2 n=1 Tax=Latrodectus hasselti TaxID=256736 RepID=A0A482Z8M0_LATHA